MIVGMIIAKGHSTRIRRKRLKLFCGKPLMAWTLIQCNNSQIDETWVSTDDNEIADITEEYGCNVYWREHPEESYDVTSGAIPGWFLGNFIGKKYPDLEMALSLFSNCPLRKPNDIDKCINLCRKKKTTVVMAVPQYETFIYHRQNGDLMVPVIMDKQFEYALMVAGLNCIPAERVRKQWVDTPMPDLGNPKVLQEVLHWDNPESIKKALVSLDNNPPMQYIQAEHWQTIEIDYQDEFDLAEFYMKKYILNNGGDVYERYWLERSLRRGPY